MSTDRFNLLIWVGLATAVASLLGLTLFASSGSGSAHDASKLEKALNRQIAYQSRIDFIQRIYSPVEALRQQQALPQALLKLGEISRDYPGEAHGLMLRGMILYQQQALQPALESLALGLKANGDYIERNSPLQQRALIEKIANEGRQQLSARLRKQPDNRALELGLKNAYYLQSRLAGGCE